MNFVIILVVVIAIIVSGILLLKRTAKKFHLSDEQLKRIKERNESWDRNQD